MVSRDTGIHVGVGHGALDRIAHDVDDAQRGKIPADFLNDRENAITRVVSTGAGAGDIGMMRPKQLLQVDVPKDRNYSAVLDMLDDNPYALQVTKIAQGKHKRGPAEMAVGSLSYSNHQNVGDDCFT
jgi:hypothetical protein